MNFIVTSMHNTIVTTTRKSAVRYLPYWPSDSPAPDRMKVVKWGSGLEDRVEKFMGGVRRQGKIRKGRAEESAGKHFNLFFGH